MTPNDVQIDVLMRRHAKHSSGEAPPEHLDADELNAFAEGALPPAARARYVSHLAGCDNCRRLVSQLAMSAGAVTKAEPVGSTETERAPWSQRLATFFAPRTLRYAAFAVVLIAAAGVVFLMARRPANNSALVAKNEQGNPPAATVVKPADQVAPQANTSNGGRPDTNRNGNTAESGQKPKVAQERDESKVTTVTVPPAPPGQTLPAATPALAMKRAESESRPSYAPPPPGESQGVEAKSRPQSNVGGLASGPRKSASTDDKYKNTDRLAAPTMAKDRAVDESNRAAMNQAPQSSSRTSQEKRGGPKRSQENVAQTNQLQIEPSQKQSTGTTSPAKPDAAPETRSVGGRKFRRQGGSWIDLKFKTSMSLRTITRGSDEFSSLDSGLRSISSQLSGEIIVVWKNKAYRIH
jgi:anti-sigma factor RsiW